MSGFFIIILVVVIGIIFGNIMLLKHSANMKLPSLKDLEPTEKENSDKTGVDAREQESTQSASQTNSKDDSLPKS